MRAWWRGIPGLLVVLGGLGAACSTPPAVTPSTPAPVVVATEAPTATVPVAVASPSPAASPTMSPAAVAPTRSPSPSPVVPPPVVSPPPLPSPVGSPSSGAPAGKPTGSGATPATKPGGSGSAPASKPASSAAACGPDAIPSTQAAQAVGREATIAIARVEASYRSEVRGQPTFLNDAPFPRHTFTAVVWGEHRAAFQPPPETYHGRPVCVTGIVTRFQNRPQIEVTSPSQLRSPEED